MSLGGKRKQMNNYNNNNLKQKQEQIWNGLTCRIVLVTAILNSVTHNLYSHQIYLSTVLFK